MNTIPIALISTDRVLYLQCSLGENYPQANWFFFANEETQVDFETLSMVLNDYDENEVSIFLLVSQS